jgi:hypothetical protein
MYKVPRGALKPLTVMGVLPRWPVGLAVSTDRPPRGQNAVARIDKASEQPSRTRTQSLSTSPMWPRDGTSSVAGNYSAPGSNSITINWLPWSTRVVRCSWSCLAAWRTNLVLTTTSSAAKSAPRVVPG